MDKNENAIGPFPDRPAPRSDRPPATIANVRHLLAHEGITVRYNMIKKRDEIAIPGWQGCPDTMEEATLQYIISLAAQHHMPVGTVPGFVEAVANSEAHNPMADWIRSVPWDEADRLPAMHATLVTADDFPVDLKETLLRKWLRSIAAAAIMPQFRTRGVLTLQGAQNIGKSSWIKRLISDPALADEMVKLGHHLDASNKDSILSAISFAIVELGELDSSLKNDVARLKGFLTDDYDRVRRPYGKRESSFPRRTVFAASVNEQQFLKDTTGNTRFWTLPVVSIDHAHEIDMQQVFAQLACEVEAGEQWWLTKAENEALEEMNAAHQSVSPIMEKLAVLIDRERIGEPGLPAMTATEVVEHLEMPPTMANAREAGAALRSLLGPHKRITGINRWRVPFLQAPSSGSPFERLGVSATDRPGLPPAAPGDVF